MNILAGLAAGLHFAPVGDESSIEVSEDAKTNGVAHALATYCGIKDEEIGALIKGVYGKIESEAKMSEIISSLEIY